MTLDEASKAPVWDSVFWEDLRLTGTPQAERFLSELWEDSMSGAACSCDTCVVRGVLETVWPFITDAIMRRLEARTDA